MTLSFYTGPRKEFPPEYFLLVLFVVLVLIYHIEFSNTVVSLFLIGIFSLVLRANIWYSAPHFSKDPRLHLGITGFINKSGRMVPNEVDDYFHYPIADISSGMVSIITNTEPKQALFLSIGIIGSLNIIFIYIFINRVFNKNSKKMATYAALLSSISAFHLVLTTGLKPQTVGASLLLTAIFANEIHSNSRRIFLIVLFALVMLFTHPLAPVLLSGVLIFYYIISYLTELFSNKGPMHSFDVQKDPAIVAGIVIFIMTFTRFVQVGHLRIQILRVHSAFSPSDSASLSNFAASGRIVTNSKILLQLSDILLQSGTLLIFGLLTGVGGIIYTYHKILQWDPEVAGEQWLITSSILISVFSVGLIGRTNTVRRAATVILAVSIPISLYGIYWLQRRWGDFGRVTAAIIIFIGAFLGIANPGVYLTERNSGFQPLIYDSELAMIDHYNQHSFSSVKEGSINSYTDSYTRSSAYDEHIKDGNPTPRSTYYSNLLKAKDYRLVDTDHLEKRLGENHESVYLYRTYYSEFTGVKPPPHSNTVYDSGSAKLLM
jgi:hypothetical protein